MCLLSHNCYYGAVDVDFKEAPPSLFGENFATLAKERIEAAAALTKKTLEIDMSR